MFVELEMENLNQRSTYRARLAQDQRMIRNKRPDNLQIGGNSDEISYSHYSPRILTNSKIQDKTQNEVFGPKLHKALEDPSQFYRGRIFKNMTESEKRQRQGKKRNFHYNPNHFEDYSPKISNNQNGLSIHLPGATVNVRSSDLSLRNNKRNTNPKHDVLYSDSTINSQSFVRSTCTKCPAERIVIAGKGVNKVALMEPEIQGCGNSPPPPNAQFKIIHGSRIGDLLNEGSHTVVGQILVNNQVQQFCQYRYNVVVQRCPALNLPSGVLSWCPKGTVWGAVCHLSCANKNHRLKGNKMIFCKDDIEWSAPPPQCEEPKRNWCSIKQISKHGEITCDTPKFDPSVPEFGVPEGSVCSVLCHGGQKPEAPKIITCKSGKWQGRPVCKKSRRRRHKLSRKHPQQHNYEGSHF